jgi:nucleotide-binding universal stress UspA family protein
MLLCYDGSDNGLRGAWMVVLGSRRRRLRPSIARRVIRKADRPVLVAPAAA